MHSKAPQILTTSDSGQAAAICKQCGYSIIIGKAPALCYGGRIRVRVSCFCGDLTLGQDEDLTAILSRLSKSADSI